MSNALAVGGLSSDKKWNPLYSNLISEMDKLFEGAFDATFVPSSSFSPKIDVREQEDKYIVIAEIPGVPENEINVSYEDGRLTISGDKKEEKTEEKEGYHYYERIHGAFERSIRLPHRLLNSEGIRAEHNNGVLRIEIPKIPKTELVKRIPINRA